jgi:transglutaminase-like putative cysteine protease
MTARIGRRSFLRAASFASISRVFRDSALLARDNGAWRTFEVTTRVEVLKPSGTTRIWVPVPLRHTPFQKAIARKIVCEGGTAKTIEKRADALAMVTAEFPEGIRPILTVTDRIATRNWSVDLTQDHPVHQADHRELQHFLQPTKLLPTDGIVKQTALEITRTAHDDIDKARHIYDWVVDNTYRDPKTAGCGRGDIRFMLESRDLGGKCADLNALYVGLARAAGLPARDVYGIRVAPSNLGYKSLGANSSDVTKSQHCRAEVYLTEHGWVPVDPADVRKVILEEPPGKHPLSDTVVQQARARLFGAWEMNWIGYNYAHDVALPGSSGPPVAFLMYPQAETAAGRLDSLAPQNFQYEITAYQVGGSARP